MQPSTHNATLIRPKPRSTSFGDRATTGLPADLLNRAARRLEILSWLYAFTFLMAAFVPPLPFPNLRQALVSHPANWAPGVISIAVAIAVALTIRLASLTPATVTIIALVFEVVSSYGIAAAEFLRPEGLAFSDTAWTGLSWVAVWMPLFNVVVPTAPRYAALAALASATSVPVMIALSLRLFPTHSPGGLMLFLMFGFPYLLVVIMAYVGARVVYALGTEVTRARELGSYRLETRLGAGGMGEVWRASHRLLVRPAAIKLIRSSLAGHGSHISDDARRRFEREAQVIARLRSPHTVTLFDFGITDDGSFYYVMELLDGLDAESMVKQFGPMPAERVVHLLRQICHSLSEAESCGLVHRDIKPANIFLCRYGEDHDFVKVLDFGIAKAVRGPSAEAETAITLGTVIQGTPAFIAPEQATGGDVDSRADIYSTGCVAYWLLTGELVFTADSAIRLLLAHAQAEPDPPSSRTELPIPAALEALVMACLAKDRNLRPASARELLRRLEALPLRQAWTAERAREWWHTHLPPTRADRPTLNAPEQGPSNRPHRGVNRYSMTTSETSTRETLGFQAEVAQLLHLMVHSLYGNKEIFLRELVSNASDAADKLRFEAMRDQALFENDPDLRIRVSYDASARTITVSDNGIGMSRQEVIEQIGTIAKSGTREFLSRLAADEAKGAHLIGQFGVGFYSAFIVADRVTLTTRRGGLTAEHGVRWESTGEGSYTVETIEKPTRGTDVVLHLRPDEDDLLSGMRLRDILRKYSDHITVPILMKKERWDPTAKTSVATDEDEQINQASALWARPKSEISESQYHECYKHVAHDFEPPLAYTHAKVEGRQEFTQLFFIPARAPFDLWDRTHRHGIKLYVRRVFIMDDAEQLMPAYLRFVRGIIDSNDLPLNVSREILQQSRDVQTIRAASIKRVLSLLEDLAENHAEKFAAFWKEFGRVLKEGVAEDAANRERIARLLRFASTRNDAEEQTATLPDYVSRMKDGQDAIYYITADSFAAARNSPHLEIFRKRGVEVLLLSDRVDEWVVSMLTEFEGKPLRSVTKGGLDLRTLGGDAASTEPAIKPDEHTALVERMQSVLKARASAVRVTDRLTDSPACLVTDEHEMSTHLERMLKAAGQQVPGARPVLEINPRHPIVQRLSDEADDQRFADWSHILFDQATLAEGGQLDDPASFVRRLNDVMLAMAGRTASRLWTPGE